MKPASVALLGAYCHTGRFVAAEFRRRGWSPILCGRDARKLDALQSLFPGLERRVAAADDPASLDRAVEDVEAIVNCAGPFLDTGIPVVQAALRAGVHYLDITAEQESARRCFEMFDTPAKQRGITVIPAMGFYGGLADLLATWVIDDWPRADAITVATALSSWHPTAGTRLTGDRNTYPRVVVEDGRLAALPLPPPKREWRFPEPFGLQHMTGVPLSEIITMHQHLQCAEIMSYLNDRSLSDLRDPATPSTPAGRCPGSLCAALLDDGSSVLWRQGAIESRQRSGHLRRDSASGSGSNRAPFATSVTRCRRACARRDVRCR